MRTAVQFVPIVTTVVALAFAGVVMGRWIERRSPHLLWWAIGMLTYAAGTITESTTTLFGWHEPVFRAWYITGALLGGAPLAQGQEGFERCLFEQGIAPRQQDDIEVGVTKDLFADLPLVDAQADGLDLAAVPQFAHGLVATVEEGL